jgi:hypothetical protein
LGVLRNRAAGAAGQRQQAQVGLEQSPIGQDRMERLWPPRVVGFAAVATVVVGLTGPGIMPPVLEAALDLGALFCYLLALRVALPHWPLLAPPLVRWLSGMEPAILPVTTLVAAALVLGSNPGLPWTVVVPCWLMLVLAVGPWLDGGGSPSETPDWGLTALAAAAITVPVPFFVVATSAGTPAPLVALLAGLGAVVPSWRLIHLAGGSWSGSWPRAIGVAVVVGLAAVMIARLQVPGPLLPVALLIGWYGLTGVASNGRRRRALSFSAFVVLAAAMLALAAPT